MQENSTNALTSDQVVARFAMLFRGLKRGYGLLHGENVKQPLSLRLYREHLEGQTSIGIYPMTEDAVVGWAAVDIDTGRLEDAIAVFSAITELGVNCGVHVFTSRSKGYHIIVFFDGWVPARTVRAVLKDAVRQAGLDPLTEVFPKQNKLTESRKWGNYVNLPYYGKAEPGRRCALDPQTGQPMTLPQFLLAVHPFPVDALDVAAAGLPDPDDHDQEGEHGKTKSNEQVAEVFTRTYGVGFRRSTEGLPRAIGCLGGRGFPEDAVVALLVPWAREHLNPPLGDEEIEKHVRSMFGRYDYEDRQYEPIVPRRGVGVIR